MADTPVTDINKLSKSTLGVIQANAGSQGVTPEEYLKSRGGVYASGYYGDTPEFRRLSDAEYAAAAKGGAKDINAALAVKRRAAIIANPSLIEDPRIRMSYQSGRITIDDVLNADLPGSATKSQRTFESIGAMADGTPIYGYGADGKPVTSPSGEIYSTTSSSDAITAFSSGSSPLSTSSSTTSTGATGTNAQKAERQSAYDLLYSEFSKYGLESLVAPLKGLIVSGASPSEFTIRLRETPEYQKRFAGNAQRIANGLTAIDEATYLAKEDAYQNLMRNYGLPDTYWKTGPLGTQDGFTKLIANDVSAVELENRLQTAQQRVVNANPEVAYALKAFYPDITNGDILAYALDPKNALDAINRKVTAAEIGGAALSQGLTTSLGGAEGLAAYGITKNQAEQGYQTVAGVLPRASQLADIYKQGPYTQGTAEAEVFGTQGAAEAKKRREKLVSLETASFGGSSGVGALGRDKAIYGATQGQTGQY
jgi:hypothetical protein